MKQEAINQEMAAAIVAMQGQLAAVKKGKQGYGYKYADLAQCWEAVEKPLQDNNLAVVQFPCEAPAGFVGLETILVHGPTGCTIGDKAFIPVKNAADPQAAGSGYTYLRRYGLSAALGLRTEDDDGAAAKGSKNAAVAQAAPVKPDTAAIMGALKVQTSVVTMKEMYQLNKAANYTEPDKTNLLKQMAEFIKEKQK